MDTALAFVLFFAALMLAITQNVTLVYPLAFGLLCFMFIALRRGYSFASIITMMREGAKKSLIVIQIFVLIGAITAVWRASGTVAFIVYHGIALINPHYFILSAFLLSSLVSFLLGTAFGTVGTIGIIMMVLAKAGGVDVSVAAGAIIAGAYFGDRCSAMSSSASLVAILTKTNIYTNLRNMFATTWLPLALSIAGYGLLSPANSLAVSDTRISNEILQTFSLSPIVALPAALVLVLAAFRVNVKQSMGASILAGIAIGILVQHQSLPDMVRYLVFGYQTTQAGFFANIIQGGGLISMVNVALIVLLSSAYAGIFSGTDILRDIDALFARLNQRIGLYAGTIGIGTLSAAFGCNQTLAVILTHQFQHQTYENQNTSRYRLALDMENTVIVISALIPWNIAGAMPAAALSADVGFLPYAFYLWLVPLTYWFTRRKSIAGEENVPHK